MCYTTEQFDGTIRQLSECIHNKDWHKGLNLLTELSISIMRNLR
jgi:hypothetical protein